MNDDFYVGYLPKAPPKLGGWMIRVVAGLVGVGLAGGALLTLRQPPFADSKFEFGVERDFAGVIETWPYPMLRNTAGTFLLVAQGKHGADDQVRPFSGKGVRLRGTLIQRGPDRMLELVPKSVQEIASLSVEPASIPIDIGPVRLRGEIVDSKCFLGVMNPGNGKVHRDCAVRCISGGAPPAFVVNDTDGESRVLLLVGSDGRQLNKEVLSFVAEPLEIPGRLVRSHSSLILKAEPSDFLRNPE